MASWVLGAILAIAPPPSPTAAQRECAAWAETALGIAEQRDAGVDGNEVETQLMSNGPRHQVLALVNIVRFAYERRDLTPRQVQRAVFVDCSRWYGVPVPPESAI